MGDWDRYAVTHVRYWEDEQDRLKHVKRRGIDTGEKEVGEPEVARRRSVLLDVRDGDGYLTAVEEDGKLKLRDEVRVVDTVDGDYLRVDGEEEPEDSLGGLPTF
jgi:hypothetical protein